MSRVIVAVAVISVGVGLLDLGWSNFFLADDQGVAGVEVESEMVDSTVVRVGGVRITIPVPNSYSQIPDELSHVREFLDSFDGPKNRLLARSVLTTDIESLNEDTWPEYLHYASAITPKRLLNTRVTTEKFVSFRRSVHKTATNNPRLSELIQRGAKRQQEVLKSEWGSTVEVAVNESKAFGPFIDREDLITTCVINKIARKRPDGEVVVKTVAISMANVLVRQKVISLQVGGKESELPELQKLVTDWAEQILTTNSEPEPAASQK